MTYHAGPLGDLTGRVVGNGDCVAFVQAAAGVPHISNWRRGTRVRGGGVMPRHRNRDIRSRWTYGTHTDGRSHAALLIGATPEGLLVWDHQVGHHVQQRVVCDARRRDVLAVNDASAYHVIDGPAPTRASRELAAAQKSSQQAKFASPGPGRSLAYRVM